MFCHTANPKVTSQTFVWQVVCIRGEIGKQELKNYSQATNLVLTKAAIAFGNFQEKKVTKKTDIFCSESGKNGSLIWFIFLLAVLNNLLLTNQVCL